MSINKRIIALPDIHYPYNIDLSGIMTFMKDFKPTHIIFLGDLLDFSYLGRFAEGDNKGKEGKRIKKDYENISLIVKALKGCAPKAQTIYLLGNHELRIEYEINHDPMLEGLIEVKENIGHLFDEMHPYGYVWEASKYLGYMHGIYWNKYHAQKTSTEFAEMSIIYGHVHDRQLHTRMNRRDKTPKPRYSQSIGCLCTLSPEWLTRRGRTNKWVNAFSVAYVWGNSKKSGYFNEYTIHIVNGKFCWNGKIYE